MRVAVAGGTGLVGRHAVRVLTETGHDVVVIARSTGVDVITGDGLADALAGVDAVIDVTNTAQTDAAAAQEFFATVARNLLSAEEEAGVHHHVVLSILGLDRIHHSGHYAGKRRQRDIAESGSIDATILYATQFFEFAELVVGWTRDGDTAVLAPLLVQPVAAADVAHVLAELAVGAPQRRTIDLAGPETQDFVDMARRVFAARGEMIKLVPSWRDGPFRVEMAGEVLLPGDDARIAPTTFDEWLASGGGLS